MSLEQILQALQTEAERQTGEIERGATAEVERIQTEAETAAESARRKHWPAVQASLKAEQARILNQARLEALRVVMGTREELIEMALASAAQRLEALSDSELYPQLLRELACEAFVALDTERHLCLRVASGDVAAMERVVREAGLPATVEGGLEHGPPPDSALGGLVASTPDGRIAFVNTFAARLQRTASLYRSQIAAMLVDHTLEG